jgi:hypothetical protein
MRHFVAAGEICPLPIQLTGIHCDRIVGKPELPSSDRGRENGNFGNSQSPVRAGTCPLVHILGTIGSKA